MAWEKDLLGLYLSGHPLDKHRDKLEKAEHKLKDIKDLKNGDLVIVGGIVEDVRPIMTRRGDRMAFIKLADFTDSIEAVCFTDVYAKHKDILIPDACLAVRARVSFRNGEPSIVMEGVKSLE